MKSGGGDHRGSIFRLLVGSALLNDKDSSFVCTTWDIKKPTQEMRRSEHSIEQAVTRIIGAMPFLWLEVNDDAGPDNRRKIIERQSIALLSNFAKPPLDRPSTKWRGLSCDHGECLVRGSGLWNQDYVDESYDPAFLDVMEALIERG